MKHHPLTRRAFLQGTGGFMLALPTLISLLPRSARAQASAAPLRYVQWMSNHGQFEHKYWPDPKHAPSDPASRAGVTLADVRVRKLSAISGPLSEILGSGFDPLRGKMNLIRGLDVITSSHFHTASAPTCASWPLLDDLRPGFSYSVDTILETSKRIYPTPARVPALRVTPGVKDTGSRGSFSWTVQNGKPYILPCLESPLAALEKVFAAPSSAVTSETAAAVRLTDAVLEDYRALSGSGRLGSDDKQLLSSYLDLLADVQNRMKVTGPACSLPKQAAESDYDTIHKNAVDVTVAALLCGGTRVVAYNCHQGSATQYDDKTFHGWAHNDAEKHAGMMKWRYQQLAYLLRTMDAFKESNGLSLLDNAVVYASNGLSVPDHGIGHLENMPVIVAGSAGGKLSTGDYIDFGKRPLNNLLVTLFAAFGLAPTDYERNGVVGFGDYAGDNAEKYSAYLSASERRKPLPYLFKG